ncbi:MAG: DUF1501 domain-containing protein [Candidatus Hydrogenedentes bacterium]|nr:DUF1501 domain-containing protein [Candidatus Hydrogenedentota bacterium]
MNLTRRQFLHNVAVLSAVGVAPRFLTAAAEETVNAIQGFKDDRILVVVQLGGGNDGINTVVPYGDDTYYRMRPKLGLKGDQLLRLNDYAALHGKMRGFMELYDAGKLGIIQGVGYPNPNRSHFRSMEILHTATDSEIYSGTGWIGRYFDNTCSGEARPQAGVAIAAERPQAFDSERGYGISTLNPAKFGWDAGKSVDTEANFKALNQPNPTDNSTLDFLRHTSTNALMSSHEVQEAARKGQVEELARGRGKLNQLAMIAGLIRGGLATRIYYVDTSGFDTHANQLGAHENLLGTVSKLLSEFQAQLESDGTADRVTTLVFSEFGRRVQENGSGGTDHGTAAPMFLMGKHIKPGLHGAYPSLTDLDDGDLKFTTDFRAVYASILNQWFDTDPTKIIQGNFASLPLLA